MRTVFAFTAGAGEVISSPADALKRAGVTPLVATDAGLLAAAVLSEASAAHYAAGHEQAVAGIIGAVADVREVALLVEIFGPRLFVVATADSPLARTAAFVLGEGDAEAGWDRLARLAAGLPYITPTRQEFAMFHAYAAALRSAGFRGGVGAAIADSEGDIVAVGTSEVPAPGGGQYWPDHPGDARDFVLGFDPATAARRATVTALVEHLAAKGLALPGTIDDIVDAFVGELDDGPRSEGLGSGAFPAQTFESLGRVVHAEMAALVAAGRHGVSVSRCSAYVTALPCRQCLRHLIAAGLRSIEYLGPRLAEAPSFHRDALDTTGTSDGLVHLVPFQGVTPLAFARLFDRGLPAIDLKAARLLEQHTLAAHAVELLPMLERSAPHAATYVKALAQWAQH